MPRHLATPRRQRLSRRSLLAASVVLPALGVSLPAQADPGDPHEGIVDVDLAGAAQADDAGTAVRVLEQPGATMIGCSWKAARPQEIAVRGQLSDTGQWSDWLALDPLAEPDGAAAPTATQAVWLGGPTTSIQVRAQADGRDATDQLIAHVITTVRTSADLNAARTRTRIAAAASSSSGTFQPGTGSPTVVSRSGWKADESLVRNSPSYASELKAAVLHHSEGSNSYTAADVPGIIRGFLTYHTQSQGWADIGYNALVDRFGTIYEGRAGGLTRAVVGAHATGSNTGSFGVCMIGSYMSETPPDAQLNAVADIMAWKLGGSYVFDVSSRTTLDLKDIPRVIGHKDARSVSTDCPGTVGYQQLPKVRQLVQDRLGRYRTEAYQAYVDNGGAAVFGTVTDIDHTEGGSRVTRFSSGYRVVVTDGAATAFDSAGNPLGAAMPAVIGAIGAKWRASGGVAGLGRPLATEYAVAGGAQQRFERGTITWSEATGAWNTIGAIHGLWEAQGGAAGGLGFPAGDETSAARGGARQAFTRATIYFHPDTGAQFVFGAIRSTYDALGPGSALGYPVAGETAIPGGRGQRFQRGMICWSAQRGTLVVLGGIYQTWLRLGGPDGAYGAPVGGERAQAGGGASQEFTGGTILFAPSGVSNGVRGAIGARYLASGGPAWIGYPTSGEYVTGGLVRQDFERGSLTWSASGGVALVAR